MRMPVATVVAMVADGMTVPETLADLPDLTREDVVEARRFAAEAVCERELPLGRGRPRSGPTGKSNADLCGH
ncbi:MAG TPA: DUF433 domain-containing protein [Micromonosporaceae bacterium]|nr:DUF433 domain-containing protein [Micromonosporaceae bacterium]